MTAGLPTTGLVFDIQRFCTHDGPGIRTTVFLKGCPLRCAWCHNPESQRSEPELLFSPRLCMECDACTAVCPGGSARRVLADRIDNPAICRQCLACAPVCPSGAIRISGQRQTPEQVLEIVEKDRVFYEESGGGLTLSGGEPMQQFEFTAALLTAARARGLHTCLETSGAASASHYAAIVPTVDLFLWDIKDTDPQRHLDLTGLSLAGGLERLRQIDAAGARIVLRCILIDGVNMEREHIQNIAALCECLHRLDGVDLLPYHPLGGSKYEQLGRRPPNPRLKPPAPAQVQDAVDRLKSHGIPCTVL